MVRVYTYTMHSHSHLLHSRDITPAVHMYQVHVHTCTCTYMYMYTCTMYKVQPRSPSRCRNRRGRHCGAEHTTFAATSVVDDAESEQGGNVHMHYTHALHRKQIMQCFSLEDTASVYLNICIYGPVHSVSTTRCRITLTSPRGT